MNDRLLPRHIDNTYRGHRPALWLFGLIVLVKGGIGLVLSLWPATGRAGRDALGPV
ncbi:MAG: hypothetical protein ACREMH_03525 [Gemmatimonadales bacterium]